MALTATPTGLYFPEWVSRFSGVSNATALNAATNKSAMIGHVYWEGRAASKTVSSAGGQIKWLPGTSNTFSSGSSTIDIGIQDVDSVNGPPVRGDGTFDVKATMTGGVTTITDSTWNTVSMTSGSKTIAHGDLVAVVLDMTARGGTDVVRTSSAAGPSTAGVNVRPTMTQFTSGAWGTGAGGALPNVYIVADDGTLGIFDAALPITSTSSETYGDGSNPDERGLIFQVPWDCKIDAYSLILGGSNANSDATLAVYSNPTGTPAVVSGSSVNILGENFERTGSAFMCQILLPAEISLTKNTDYCLALRGTGSSNMILALDTIPDTNLRKFITGGTTVKKATRNNGSGAFTAESPAVTMYMMAMRISQFYDTAGGAAGAGFSGAFVG
jgi:hypothetical protein